jgi:hypothetical protein
MSLLHEFADALVKVSEKAGSESSLVCRNLSIFRILETWWIDSLLNFFIVYVEMIHNAFHDKHPEQVRALTCRSYLEHVAAAYAHDRKVPFATEKGCFVAHLFSSRYSCSIPPFGTALATSSQHLMKLLPSQPSMAAYDRITQPKVLFVTFVERTLRRLKVALPKLQQQGNLEVCLLDAGLGMSGTSDLVADLKQDGLVSSSIQDWLSVREAKLLVRQARSRLSKDWRRVKTECNSELAHTYRGIPIFPYAERLLESFCITGGIYATLISEIASRIIERCQPALIVSFEEHGLCRAMNLLGRRLGIPSLTIFPHPVDMHIGLVRRSADWLAVSGKHMHDEFVSKACRPPETVRIVGDILADRILSTPRPEARASVCRSLGLSPEQKIVVLLPTWPDYYMTQDHIRILFQRTFLATRQLSTVQVVVKAHPKQNLAGLQRDMVVWQCNAVTTQDYDLTELCLAADLMCMVDTTAGMQAMIAGTPLIIVAPQALLEGLDVANSYIKGGGAVHLDDKDDPLPVFRRLLYDQAARQEQINRARRFASHFVGPQDGGSSRRLAEFIAELIRGQGGQG